MTRITNAESAAPHAGSPSPASPLRHIHAHVGDPGTWGARVLVLAYGFLIVIMVHLYTATLASRLTQQRLANNIQSKADLPGKPVQTWCVLRACAVAQQHGQQASTTARTLYTFVKKRQREGQPVARCCSIQPPLAGCKMPACSRST